MPKHHEEENNSVSYDEAFELTGHGPYNYLALFTCCIIMMAFAMDMFGFNVVVAGATCDLNLGLTEIGILASAPYAGIIFSFPWGYYADVYGRRRALLLAASGGFIFAALSSISMNWQFMLVVKLIGCSFSSACMMLSMTLLGECTGTKHRSKYLFILNSFNLSSEFISFGLAYLILPLDFNVYIPWLNIKYRPWRLYTIASALPLGIGALFMFFLYESPKFLASRGSNDEALDILKNIFKRNGGRKEDFPVKSIEVSNSVSDAKISFWDSVVKQTLPIFKAPLRWRTLQLYYLLALCCATNNVFLMWYPVIVNFFFNSLATGTADDKTFCEKVFNNASSEDTAFICDDTISTNTIYSGMLYGIFFCVVSLAASKVAHHRRPVLIVTLLVSGVSGLLLSLKNYIANIVFFTLLQSTCVGIASIASYFVDLYPTSCRGLVSSLGIMVGRLFSFTGVNIIGILIKDYCSLTFYVWSIFIFSGIVVTLFLPSEKAMKNMKTISQCPEK